jgi:hypothetical protein
VIVETILEKLRTWDLAGLVKLCDDRPVWLGVALACGGAVLALSGSHRWLGRAVAGLLGALAGWIVVPWAEARLSLHVPGMPWSAVGVLAVLGVVAPSALFLIVAGVGCGLVMWKRWPDRLWSVAVPTGVVAGLLFGWLHRAVVAVASAALGAALFAAGVSALVLNTTWGMKLTLYPVVPGLLAAVVFIAAAAYQLTRRPKAGRKRARKAAAPDVQAAA